MPQARIRARTNLAALPRGRETTVELTRRVQHLADNGYVDIIDVIPDPQPELPLVVELRTTQPQASRPIPGVHDVQLPPSTPSPRRAPKVLPAEDQALIEAVRGELAADTADPGD